MGSQMELLALATLHEFQNSLVFQSVFPSAMLELEWAGGARKKLKQKK